jgi:hypothetical protein
MAAMVAPEDPVPRATQLLPAETAETAATAGQAGSTASVVTAAMAVLVGR